MKTASLLKKNESRIFCQRFVIHIILMEYILINVWLDYDVP